MFSTVLILIVSINSYLGIQPHIYHHHATYYYSDIGTLEHIEECRPSKAFLHKSLDKQYRILSKLDLHRTLVVVVLKTKIMLRSLVVKVISDHYQRTSLRSRRTV